MHRPWFEHLLVQEWLPAAPRAVAALARGVAVLDVGCGVGRSTVAMARAYPDSTFMGIDLHEPSVERARALAREAGLVNIRFSTRAVEALTKTDGPFQLVLAVDCVHDMARPVEALRAVRDLLSPDGVVFWSEPTGSHEPLENRNPQGRLRSNLSPFHCLTVSLAEGGVGLGTIIGEAGARALAAQAGFTAFERLPVDSPTQQFFLLKAPAGPPCERS